MLADKFRVLSQREKVLALTLGITLLMTGLTYVMPLVIPFRQPASASTIIPSQNTSIPAGIVVPLAPKLRTDNIKNPFLIPSQYRVEKEGVGANTVPGSSRPPVIAKPVLCGVISSNNVKMAILEWHDNSETLGVGGSIGEYRIVAIADNQVVLDGPEGRVVLNLGR